MNRGNRAFQVQRIAPEHLAPVWSRCTELAERMNPPSVFCAGDWLGACAAHGPSQDHLRVLAIIDPERAGAIVGILPLVMRDNALGGHDLHFLGAEFHPDPLGMICGPEDLEDGVAAVRRHLERNQDWDRLILDHCTDRDVRAWGVPALTTSVAPYIALPPDFEDLLAGFSRKKRQTLRAKVKRFGELGGEFVLGDGPALREELFESLWSLHARRADEKAIQSTFTGGRVESLHRSLVQTSDATRLFGLRLDGRIIAVIYGFEFARRFFYYQVAHDPALASLSPGLVLIFLSCRHACQRGLEEYNFLQGNEEYKTRWTGQSRSLHRVIWSRGNWRSRLLDSGAATRRGVAGLVRGRR